MPQELPRWDNVLLREFSEADIAMVMDLATDPYVPTIGSLPFAASRTDALAYINRQRGRTVEGVGWSFCVADATSNAALGGAGLWVDHEDPHRMTAGYSVAPRVRDRVLARHGDPMTGQVFDYPRPGWSLEQRHQHRIWDVRLVRATVTDDSRPLTFFCGGSRNSAMFLDLFDGVFVLEVDVETLNRRLDARLADEFGSTVEERALVIRVHRTREDLPVGSVSIDATRPLPKLSTRFCTESRTSHRRRARRLVIEVHASSTV